MKRKNLIQKLKIISAGLGLIACSYFNANAQDYKAKYNTIAHKSFRISGDTSYLSLKTLDKIIDSSKTIIPRYDRNDRKIAKFLTYSPEKEAKELMTKLGFFVRNMVSDPFAQLGDPREALVLLAIAEENNLPLYGVLVPEHYGYQAYGNILLRWGEDGKHKVLNQQNKVNKGDFLYNPCSLQCFNDAEEIDNNKLLNEKVLEKNIYLTNLNKKQLLGLANYQKARRLFIKELWKNAYLKKLPEKSPKKIGHKKTIKACNKAIRLFPKFPSSYELKGECFHRMRNYKKAIKSYNKAIKINPEPTKYLKRGFIFIKLNEDEKALKDYEQAKKLDPNHKDLSSYYKEHFKKIEEKLNEK